MVPRMAGKMPVVVVSPRLSWQPRCTEKGEVPLTALFSSGAVVSWSCLAVYPRPHHQKRPGPSLPPRHQHLPDGGRAASTGPNCHGGVMHGSVVAVAAAGAIAGLATDAAGKTT